MNKDFDFEKLLENLENFTFEEILNQMQTEIPVECIGNEVYEDEDLYEFLDELGAIIDNYGVGYVVISTETGKFYELPYEDRENRFDDDLPKETILFFDKDRIYDVTDSHVD